METGQFPSIDHPVSSIDRTDPSRESPVSVNRRKLDFLLKDRCCLLRKLDGQLTETEWAIDGYWTDYWWKEWSVLMEAVQQIFIILWARKCNFAELWNLRFCGHLAFFNSFSAFLRLENVIFAESWNPEFNGTKRRVSKF